MSQTFQEVVKEEMQKRNIATAEILAAGSGLSLPEFDRLFAGKVPEPEVVRELAEYLNITPEKVIASIQETCEQRRAERSHPKEGVKNISIEKKSLRPGRG